MHTEIWKDETIQYLRFALKYSYQSIFKHVKSLDKAKS